MPSHSRVVGPTAGASGHDALVEGDEKYRIEQIDSARSRLLPSVIQLGDANSKTLGFLPRAGFMAAADAGNIAVALTPDGELAGYCLYSTTQVDLRLVHVCVKAGHHGHGLAYRMIEHARARHPQARGIRLKCRRDWKASTLWPKIGFQPIGDVRGRSRAGHLLTVWWSPNEHEDLFSSAHTEEDTAVVAVDTNVFCDLHSRRFPRRKRHSGAVAVLQAAEDIELVLPFSVLGELNDTSDESERQLFLRTAAMHRKVTAPPPDVSRIYASLIAALPAEVMDSDPSLTKDARYIAEAIAGGASIFVTRDGAALQHLGPTALQLHGIAVMQPSELPAHIARQHGRHQTQQARLAETGIEATAGDSNAWSGQHILGLLNQAAGERKAHFRDRLREIAERSADDLDRSLLVEPGGAVVAAWAAQRAPDAAGVLRVELLRVRTGALRATIARQLILELRRTATRCRASHVTMAETALDSALVEILESEGFVRDPKAAKLVMTVMDHCAPWVQIRASAAALGIPEARLPEELSTAEAADLERIWWPAKILDADLPTYVVPIWGEFADELLGHQPTLLARATSLGLSREHVYYRSSRGMPDAPGRVLWYSSRRDMQLVACSRLVEAVTGAPEALHREFRHLGVWSLKQVRGEPRRDLVGALRFADTELFSHPISLRVLRGLTGGAARLPGQGPVRIDAALFKLLYEKGRS